VSRRAKPSSGVPVFTEAERAYLVKVHPLARLATVGADGTPHVTPLGMYRIEQGTDAVVTSGHDLTDTKKWRDVQRSGRAAIVVDDVLPPFRPRGIEIRGRAEAVVEDEPAIIVYPERIVAWGLNDAGRGRTARDIRHVG
jgi:pyridoxamine 5'-phosphate oxidase family protein